MFLNQRAATVMTVLFCSSLFLWVVRFEGKLPAITDTFLYTYPSQAGNLREWALGRVPLWDMDTGCGSPQLANGLSAVFYPFFWLWKWTGLSHWLVWMSLLHAGIAFLGFYLWARTQKVFSLWAVLAAVSFAGSMHLVRCWGYPIFEAAQAWTPWILWAASMFLKEGRRVWWAVLALCVTLQVLAGYPFFSFYTLVFLGLWTAFQPQPAGRKWRVGGAVLFAGGLCAVQWIPFLDYLSYSTRGHEVPWEQFPYFTKPREWLTLLSPTVLGMPEAEDYQGVTANANFLLYFGWVPLTAAVVGLFSSKVGDKKFWTLVLLLSALWMVGPYFPLLRLVPEAWLEFLNPSKAVGIFLLAACTFAGMAMTRFARGWEGPKGWLSWVVALVWMLDILAVPWRVIHPVPDPYRDPAIQAWADKVVQEAGGRRLLAFKAKGNTTLLDGPGRGDVFARAAEDWVRNLLSNSNAVWGIRGSHAYLSTWTLSMDKFWRAFNHLDHYAGDLPDVAGIGTLYLPVTLSGPHYRTIQKEGEGYLVRNERVREDLWVAGRAVTVQGPDEALGIMTGAAPGVGKDVVLLDTGTALPPPPRSLDLGQDLPQGFQRPSASRAVFRGDISSPGWLVWDETYTPGWKAWRNGRPAPVSRAEGFFMAVEAREAGEQRLEFRYEPVSFRLGAFLSLVFAAFFLGGALKVLLERTIASERRWF